MQQPLGISNPPSSTRKIICIAGIALAIRNGMPETARAGCLLFQGQSCPVQCFTYCFRNALTFRRYCSLDSMAVDYIFFKSYSSGLSSIKRA